MANISGSGTYVSTTLPNATYPTVRVIASVASGDVDLYTVPASRKAFCYGASSTNVSGGSIIVFPEIKSGGTYYRLSLNRTVTNNTFSVVSNNMLGVLPMLYLAGESVSVNMNAVGLSVFFSCVEFDASAAVSRTALITPAAGDQTIFTAGGNGATILQIAMANNSGAGRTVSVNLVPSGGSAATNNKIVSAANATNTLSTNFINGIPYQLSSGDFLNLNDDAATATQIVWVLYQQQ